MVEFTFINLNRLNLKFRFQVKTIFAYLKSYLHQNLVQSDMVHSGIQFVFMFFSDLSFSRPRKLMKDKFNQKTRARRRRRQKKVHGEINHAIKQLRPNQCL